MRCVRFEVNNRAKIGIIEHQTVRTVYGSLDTFWQLTDEVFPLSHVKLLAPCVPKQRL